MLRLSRFSNLLHNDASHWSAIGEHGTFPARQFCLAFTLALDIQNKFLIEERKPKSLPGKNNEA